jgi:glycosyltransferase involved in cell wall biosynthesis
MRILHIINTLDGGGAEKILVDMAIRQKEHHEVEVLLLTRSNLQTYIQTLADHGIPIHVLRPLKPGVIFKVAALARRLKRGRYSVVHAHLFPSQYYLAAARIFINNSGMRFITTEHSTNNRRRAFLFLKPVEQWVFNSYDAVVCISKQAEESLRSHTGDYTSRILTINNGVDIHRYHAAVPANIRQLFPALTPEKKIMMMVGRFAAVKNQQTLIRAAALLPHNTVVVFVGVGETQEECETLAKELNIADRIIFAGFRNNIPELLKASDIAVLSSHWEGMPLAALEAMAAGKALVASDVNGVSEVVGGAGILFENNNAQQLAEIITRLLDNPGLKQEVEARCLERSAMYDIQQTIEQYEQVYSGSNFHIPVTAT